MKRLNLTAVVVLFAAACGNDSLRPPPSIQLFTAADASIALGDSTQLVIKADDGATLQIDQGIGDVTGKTTVTVQPTVTTTYTLTASNSRASVTATTTVAVGHGPASQLTIAGLNSELAVDTPATLTVTIRDRFGNPVTDYTGTLHFTLTDIAAPPIPDVTFTSAMAGTTTITVQFVTEGEQSVIATDTANASLTNSTITQVRAGSATAYTLSALPSSAVAGEPLPLTITAVDRHGNVVKSYAGAAHVSSTDSTDRLPADGPFTNGVRTVSLSFVKAGQHFATTSEVGGTISTNTTTITIVSGDATQLIASGAATSAGAPTSTTVTAKDPYGNTVTTYTGTVAFSSTDQQAALPSNYTFVTGDAGTHTFSLTLKTAGAQTVTATDAASSLSGSGGFTVAPGNGTICEMNVLAKAGPEVGFRVAVKDAFSNLATGYRGTIAISASDAAAQLPAPATYTATDAGVHSFTVQLPTPGDQTITATDSANSISCQATVTIVLAQFFAVTFPGTDAWAGTPATATVTAKDGNGNTITSYAGTITFTSSDAAATLPANVTLIGTEGGTVNVNVTFNTMGLQSFTATDTADATKTGTAFRIVRGLVYTDAASGGKVRLVKNATSNASVVQLDLVSNTSLFPLTLGTNDTVRNGVFAAGMNLPLDTTKVGPDTNFLVTTAPSGSTAALNLGSGTQAKGAAINATNGVLYSGISQKRVDTTAGAASNNMRGDVAVRPFPGAASFYYSLRLKLTPGATAGTVFDGQNLGSKFHAAVRDRSGSDVFQNADFAIGKLEVQ